MFFVEFSAIFFPPLWNGEAVYSVPFRILHGAHQQAQELLTICSYWDTFSPETSSGFLSTYFAL